LHVLAEEDQFRGVAKDVQDAGKRQDLVKAEEKSGQGNKEDRPAESRDRAHHFG